MDEKAGKKLISSFLSPEWNQERERLEGEVRDALIKLVDHMGPVGGFDMQSTHEFPFKVEVRLEKPTQGA